MTDMDRKIIDMVTKAKENRQYAPTILDMVLFDMEYDEEDEEEF